MQRISVIGASGSGKTTFARALAEQLGIEHLELDAVYHQADWVPLEREVFRSRVSDFVEGERWIIDGNYSSAQDIVWARADTVIFIDPPRWRVMSQLIPRTVMRGLTKRELWNGNTEQLRNMLSPIPETNIVLWSWTTHAKRRRRFESAAQDPALSHLRFERLRSRAEAEAFVARQ
jgi:adenylate kinase family enzyme